MTTAILYPLYFIILFSSAHAHCADNDLNSGTRSFISCDFFSSNDSTAPSGPPFFETAVDVVPENEQEDIPLVTQSSQTQRLNPKNLLRKITSGKLTPRGMCVIACCCFFTSCICLGICLAIGLGSIPHQ
jgi:hypothetical protein